MGSRCVFAANPYSDYAGPNMRFSSGVLLLFSGRGG